MTNPPPTRPGLAQVSRSELLLVVTAALIASIIAVWWSWSHGAFLLYGDAEAHIHIARRLFDSHRPGITQLGSVWLPLPHLLLAPFLLVDSWWRSGFAPAIPGAACYVLACLGLYRLSRMWMSRAAASMSLVLFAANPNLLYLQTTAMTEPLFLCELIWSVLLLVEWYATLETGDGSERLLWAEIAVLVMAVYTRYDGWILAFLAWLMMAACLMRRRRLIQPSFILASMVLLLAPVGWMVYNAVVFGDWLDFMRGPYSAQAIELRTASSAADPHPGWHNPWVSLVYFTKAAEMDFAALAWGTVALVFALIGTAWAWWVYGQTPADLSANRYEGAGKAQWKEITWTLLLWLPLPFYAYSVSYGSVPIFLPVWKPFSWYNTRYGMEMLPAFALFIGFIVDGILHLVRPRNRRYKPLVLVVLFVALAANVVQMLREHPLTYEEGKKNADARGYYNAVIPQALRRLHEADPDGIVLMNTSVFSSLIPHAGLTYRQTINESDKEFYWAALGDPAGHSAIVLAFAGDEIDKAVKAHPEHLKKYQSFRAPGKGWDQLDATIYVTDTFPSAALPQPEQPSQAGDSIGQRKR